MKRSIAVVAAVLILLVSLAGCSQSNGGNSAGIDRVYLLSGRNDLIEINNGAIILTSKIEKFIGGELSFRGEELSGIKDYRTEFYFYLNGDKTIINSNISSIEGSEEGLIIAPDMGTASSEKMFNMEVWGIITGSEAVHFSLSGTLMNGETFEYSLVLNVNEVLT